MPVFTFKGPDGKTYDITAPDGTTPEDAFAVLQGQIGDQQAAPAAPATPTASAPQGTPHAPWGPQGSTLAALQSFLSDKPFDNPIVAGLARGTGLAGRVAVTGATGTAGMLGDALNTGLNMATGSKLGMPSAAIAQGLSAAGVPQPANTTERVMNTLGSVAMGGADPLANAIGQAVRGAPALYNNALPTTPAASSGLADTLREARGAGYVSPPSQAANPSIITRTAEGLSGKPQLDRLANARNQLVTDQLARKAAGLAPHEALSPESLASKMSKTYAAGYDPIRAVPQITNGRIYRNALNDVLADYGKSAPNQSNQAVYDLVDNYRTRAMSGSDAIDYIAKLRQQAGEFFRSSEPGSTDLAKAHRDVAHALEDSVGLNLQSGAVPGAENPAMFNNYLAARTALAKQSAIANAIVPGTDSVNAAKIAAQYNKKAPFTDELATIAKFNNARSGLTKLTLAPPSLKEEAGGGIAALLAAGMGSPKLAALAAATAAGRHITRSGLLSNAVQDAMAPKLVSPSLIDRLTANPALLNATPTALQGLFGPTPAQQ